MGEMTDLSRRTTLKGLGFTAAFAATPVWAQTKPTIKVPADYKTLAEAFAALPETGGVIEIGHGTYREKLNVSKPNVTLKGMGERPGDTIIVWNDGASTNGMGTFRSASLTVSGDGFRASNLTISNDYDYAASPSQAVALSITSDRAVLTNVMLLGAQDTLYAASKKGPTPSRQYYKDCYIEGHVDFIFGNALAFFDHCHINVLKRDSAFITAHSRTAETETSAYVFDHCRITVGEGSGNIYLGRAWRPYAQVVFLDSDIGAGLHPEGWREWTPGKTETYATAYFAEYGSTGPGGDMSQRVFWAKKLTAEQAAKWRLENVFPDRSWIGN
jgi:pectinesterase